MFTLFWLASILAFLMFPPLGILMFAVVFVWGLIDSYRGYDVTTPSKFLAHTAMVIWCYYVTFVFFGWLMDALDDVIETSTAWTIAGIGFVGVIILQIWAYAADG